VAGHDARSRKALDLRATPGWRCHSASLDPPDDPTAWAGDAKLAGRAVEVDDPALLERLGAGEAEAGRRPPVPGRRRARWSTPGSAIPPTTWSSRSGQEGSGPARA
jgi:hypothetical protein